MRLGFLAATCAAIALCGTAFAQTATPEFTPERVRAHVTFLADDLLEGRDAGTRGYDIAAHYVASRFAALGLEPAADGSWYQQVRFQETRLADAPARVTIDGRAFANREAVLMGASAREPEQSIEAPVVFAGYGLDMPGQGFDDYAGLDVRNKFVAVLSGYPKGTPSEIGAHLSSEKARFAEANGAIGMLTIPTRADIERRPWERRVAMAGGPSMTWLAPDGTPFTEAPGVRAGATLDAAAAKALFAGARTSLKSVLDEADREGGRPDGFALRPTVGIERSSASTTITSPNVVAVLPGSDPALAGEYVVLMAHLDHEGVDPDREGEDKIYNGALDNAAGIATMLEVARAFAESGVRPKRSILFAAVTAEEDGLLGSEYLAKHPVVDGEVVGVVNLDMPILLYDFTDVIAFGGDHSTLGQIAARAAARMDITVSPDPIPEEGIFTRSDHYSFVKEGVPSIFLMTGFAGEGEEKFNHFLSTDYHQPSDEVSLPIDWEAGARFARLNYLIAREIADAPEAPRWYADDFFGDTFAADAEKAPKSGD